MGGIRFGSAFGEEVFSDQAYADLLAQECAELTLENAVKFDWLRPHGEAADFATADRLVDFAVKHGLRPRGAALIWNDYLPDWLSRLSAREVERVFDRHIDENVGRFAGRMAAWDVVNEPFYPPQGETGGLRSGPWLTAMGPSYIERAFRRAAAADPTAELILNEAFTEEASELGASVRSRLVVLTDELLQAGVKLNTIGLQGHLKPEIGVAHAAYGQMLGQLAQRGVALAITELDVSDIAFAGNIEAVDQAVGAALDDFLKTAFAVPAVRTVIAWHLSDRYSWYRGTEWYAEDLRQRGIDPAREPRTHFFDSALNRKIAAQVLSDALKRGGKDAR